MQRIIDRKAESSTETWKSAQEPRQSDVFGATFLLLQHFNADWDSLWWCFISFQQYRIREASRQAKASDDKTAELQEAGQNLIMEIYVAATIARWRSSLVVVKPIVTVVGANHLVSESLRLWYHSRHLPGIVKVNGGGLPALRAFRGFGIFWNEMIGACLVLLFLDIIVICFRKHVANQRFVWHLFLDLVHRFLSERRKTEKVREDQKSATSNSFLLWPSRKAGPFRRTWKSAPKHRHLSPSVKCASRSAELEWSFCNI